MSTLENSYRSIYPALEQIERQARQILQTYAAPNDFLVAGRIKKLDSVLDKIETGRYRALSNFDDLVAFTVIVDTRRQIQDVIKFSKEAFRVVEIRGKDTIRDERLFSFDATRLYANLVFSEKRPELEGILFEIQIRTILQHAWSKTTHSLVYKAKNVDPRGMRLAAEMLATIEGIDRNLSTFATASRGVKKVNRPRSGQLNRLVNLIDDLVARRIVPSEHRPPNGRRFAENILDLIDHKDKNFNDMLVVLEQFFTEQSRPFPMSITLHQMALIAIHRAGLLRKATRGRKHYYHVTHELISLFPDADMIEPKVADG